MCHFGRTWRQKDEGRGFEILRGDESSPTVGSNDYESIKPELKIRCIYECRCYERKVGRQSSLWRIVQIQYGEVQ